MKLLRGLAIGLMIGVIASIIHPAPPSGVVLALCLCAIAWLVIDEIEDRFRQNKKCICGTDASGNDKNPSKQA